MRGDNIKRENSRLRRQVANILAQLNRERNKVAKLRRQLQEERNLVEELGLLWRAEIRTNRQLVDKQAAQQDPVDKAIERLHAAAVSLREQTAKERQIIQELYGNNG